MTYPVFKFYKEFVNDWSFPVANLIYKHHEKKITPQTHQVLLILILLPLHMVLFIPSFIVASLVGLPYTFYMVVTRQIILKETKQTKEQSHI